MRPARQKPFERSIIDLIAVFGKQDESECPSTSVNPLRNNSEKYFESASCPFNNENFFETDHR